MGFKTNLIAMLIIGSANSAIPTKSSKYDNNIHVTPINDFYQKPVEEEFPEIEIKEINPHKVYEMTLKVKLSDYNGEIPNDTTALGNKYFYSMFDNNIYKLDNSKKLVEVESGEVKKKFEGYLNYHDFMVFETDTSFNTIYSDKKFQIETPLHNNNFHIFFGNKDVLSYHCTAHDFLTKEDKKDGHRVNFIITNQKQ